MTLKFKLLSGIMVIAMTTFLFACSSTEVIEPQKDLALKGETITLNISCPDAEASTRADLHDGHVLRYSAILYTGTSIGESTFKERQEIIESTNKENNKIIFHVEENTYTIFVIADYIPANSTPDNYNLYNDYYYNTSSKDGRIYMRSVIDFSTNSPVNLNCVNNENYDCFAKVITVEKTPAQYETSVELNRIVSRISFVNSTVTNDEIKDISFNKLDFFYVNNLVGTPSVGTLHALSNNRTISVTGITPQSQNSDEELLFFYTLADGTNSNELYKMELTVNYDGASYTTTIPEKMIKPQANYKIKVKGPFLAEPEPLLGDIILHLSTTEREQWNTKDDVVIP